MRRWRERESGWSVWKTGWRVLRRLTVKLPYDPGPAVGCIQLDREKGVGAGSSRAMLCGRAWCGVQGAAPRSPPVRPGRGRGDEVGAAAGSPARVQRVRREPPHRRSPGWRLTAAGDFTR